MIVGVVDLNVDGVIGMGLGYLVKFFAVGKCGGEGVARGAERVEWRDRRELLGARRGLRRDHGRGGEHWRQVILVPCLGDRFDGRARILVVNNGEYVLVVVGCSSRHCSRTSLARFLQRLSD